MVPGETVVLLLLTNIAFGWAWASSRAALKELRRVRQQEMDAGILDRLELIEQNVSSMRTDVERMDEGQRFTTEVLATGRTTPTSTFYPRSAGGLNRPA